jgi:hypothetical protein
MHMRALLHCALILALVLATSVPQIFAVAHAATAAPSSTNASPATLRDALAREDADAIRSAVADINRQLGNKAGKPDVPDPVLPVPAKTSWLSAAEVAPGFTPVFAQIEKVRWWKIGLDPTKLGHALREPAAVILGNVAVVAAKQRGANLQGTERSLAIAKEAGDFLIWAQAQAGTGGFPFPASRGVSTAAPFVSAERQFRLAAKQGRLNEVIRNGWAIRDDGDGGLQFDNAECGVALFALYAVTRDQRYLDAAKKSADWAMAQPLVVNWNYNSFSVFLLARAYRVTGAQAYLDAATRKALLGVIPGQLITGTHAGRWNDAHNARAVYHYIMLRGLTELADALPASGPQRSEIVAALMRGLRARNKDFLGQGAPNKDMAMETLLMVNRVFAGDKAFLGESLSRDALDALARLVSAQARRGNVPLGPHAWGIFMAWVAEPGAP